VSYIVFTVILIASFFHAFWNFFVKKTSADKASILILGWLSFSILLLPSFLYFENISSLDTSIWPLLFIYCCIGSAYTFLLAWGYRVTDLSTLYPIARGCGVALTTVLYFLFFDRSLSVQGLLGIISIVGGTFFIGLHSLEKVNFKGLFVALMIAMCIASYSLMANYLVHKMSLLFYLTVTSFGTSMVASAFYFKNWDKLLKTFKENKKEILIVAIGGNISYVTMLWAFTYTKAPYVVALREFSIVVASVLAYVYLKEPFKKFKWLGVVFIFLGLVVLKTS